MKYKEVDLAYAAGIIDGEGCIGIYNIKSNKATFGGDFALLVQVGMSDAEPIKFLKETFGGYYLVCKGRHPGYKPRHQWRIGWLSAASLLKELYPYLKGKKEQARVAIEFQKHKRLSNDKNKMPLTQREYKIHQDFSKELKRLKRS